MGYLAERGRMFDRKPTGKLVGNLERSNSKLEPTAELLGNTNRSVDRRPVERVPDGEGQQQPVPSHQLRLNSLGCHPESVDECGLVHEVDGESAERVCVNRIRHCYLGTVMVVVVIPFSVT